MADLGGVLEVSWGILGHMHIFIYICIYIVLAVVVAGDVANSPVFIASATVNVLLPKHQGVSFKATAVYRRVSVLFERCLSM